MISQASCNVWLRMVLTSTIRTRPDVASLGISEGTEATHKLDSEDEWEDAPEMLLSEPGATYVNCA